MTLYEAVADLPLVVDDYRLRRHERDTSSGFTRVTTVFELHGDGHVGRGEDVTYDADDHDALQAAHDYDFDGEYTFDEFSTMLDDVELFPEPPGQQAARHYRRWGVESAALDLALRQAGTNLGDALGRSYDPVRFVVSTRLGEPPTFDRIAAIQAVNPTAEFKLDPVSEWSDELIADLADTGAVRLLDLKGQYEGTEVDQPADPDLYRHVLEGFPDAVVEDPALTDETRPLFDGQEDRVSWDYPITGIESVDALPFEPDWLNIKPSRFGTAESLLDTLDYCEDHDISLYGGGQFELAVGRGHIQALASLFYPDAPNDVAPAGYNDPDLDDDLPASPLAPPTNPVGIL
ncbi:hypothetical protein [Haloarchaeobius litoreus]|uniref:L-alanine-DL-glutamate epimerase n=1 Tax=Haloarchaeobius litoreus TaxID=755306 RepID=A0ABD6DCW2_9EURY|nr:hypothetical protein [Haloarchaeobius litoreus]